ncbi:hypothetical protein SOM22_08720 [Stenotrophomonas rhizophila]|uniref:hypothetical protein n=1 Tax=Stenotrophomonas rhizophila TaxID=216778 RepID=UPI002A6B1CD5|nr:hypothetical protein [Stenotrophomonas rhizophila]MDY0954658.1 hypothetical protein [Stenotrophomonas rhizophila]
MSRRNNAAVSPSPGPADRTALRRYTRWLPSLVLLVVCIAWWSPLGVIAALAAAVAVQSLLGRFDLVGDVLPVGGAKLQSAPLSPFARQPPIGDVTLGWAELGMGGPAYCTQMLRDGAIVGDIACDGGTAQRGTWTDLAGTSLRLASGYVDRSDGVLGYDEQRKVLLHFNVVPHVFWQTLGEHRQADGAVAAAAWVSRQPHVATALRGYHGLWLAPDDPALARPMQAQLCHRLPDGRKLSARLLLPDDLRLTAHPDLFTHTRPYALTLDGVDSGRHVCDLETVIASPGGHCIVVAGACLDATHRPVEGVWLVYWRGHWQAVCRHVFAGEGKQRRSASLEVLAAGDDGRLELQAYSEWADAAGWHREPLADVPLELVVEWRQTAMSVGGSGQRARLALPRR